MIEMDRRSFMRLAIAAPVGFLAGGALALSGGVLVEGMQQVTGQSAGNAGIQDFIEESCKDNPDPTGCAEKFQFTDSQKGAVTVIGPIFEEGIARGIPSLVLDFRNPQEENPFGNLIYGSGGLSMTKRELIYGAISSVIFGLGHNFNTKRKFDTNTIPVPLVVIGFGLWYLQRKLGILSNTVAHIVNNTLAISLHR